MKRRAFILSFLFMMVLSRSVSAFDLLGPIIIPLLPPPLFDPLVIIGGNSKPSEKTDYGDEIHARVSMHFLSGREKIETNNTKDKLEKFGSDIKKYKDDTGKEIKIIIEGHADSKESPRNAHAISKKRATYVKNFLIENYGFEESDMEVMAYGSEKPITSNATKEGRAKNRRVELQMLNYME